MAMPGQTICPVVRADVVANFCRQFQAMGAPTERMLGLAAIPADIIFVPDALVPLRNAYRFATIACSSLQTEHLGLHVGLASALEDLGKYGEKLSCSRTLAEYLQTGISYFNTLNTGERLWMSLHGAEIRLNCSSFDNRDLGAYQSHLATLLITAATVRKAVGPRWCPREVGLAYKSREPFPATEAFAESRIVQGLDCSYISLSRALLKTPMPDCTNDHDRVKVELGGALPTDLEALVLAQLDALSANNHDLHIDTIAASLAMNRRRLQRALDREGLSYQELLTRYRMDEAARLLASREKPVTAIALDLGYTDASNFSRAFRRHTGLTPTEYRALDERPDSTYSPLK